jgi:hypothetical protein
MPIYFFHLKATSLDIPDRSGTELSDETSAREHARLIALELMRGRETLTCSWRLDVRDRENRQCFELLFADLESSTRDEEDSGS